VSSAADRSGGGRLEVNTLAAAAWDGFVSLNPHGHFMQSHGWGRFQQTNGWTPHYLVMQGPEGPESTALLLSRQVPGSPWQVFYAPRGPVFRDPAASSARAFGTAVAEYVRAQRGAFVRFDPYWEEGGGPILPEPFRLLERTWSFWNAPKFVFWLDLQRSEDAVFAGMDRNCQRDIRAGYRKGVSFERGGAQDIGEFYRLLVSMSSAKGIAFHDESYYARLLSGLGESCEVGLFNARFDGNLISTGMSVRFGRKAWLLYAASDRNYFKLRVNRNIQWEMIRWAINTGCTRYDFRGTATGDPPSPTDPGYGVYEFKKSFGPEFTRTAGYFDLPTAWLGYPLARQVEEYVLPTAYRAKVWLDERKS
jgi:lipid II:glycine glycyltransferase (peptidoglycan interpeptide bridge formation enzyme)